jgi:hypothetical protein
MFDSVEQNKNLQALSVKQKLINHVKIKSIHLQIRRHWFSLTQSNYFTEGKGNCNFKGKNGVR